MTDLTNIGQELTEFDVKMLGTTWRIKTHEHHVSYGVVRRNIEGWVRKFLGLEHIPVGVVASLSVHRIPEERANMHIVTEESTGIYKRENIKQA